jgi:hypothetical protein
MFQKDGIIMIGGVDIDLARKKNKILDIFWVFLLDFMMSHVFYFIFSIRYNKNILLSYITFSFPDSMVLDNGKQGGHLS